MRYQAASREPFVQLARGEVVYAGGLRESLVPIAGIGIDTSDYNLLLLVKYPSSHGFFAFIDSPAYQAAYPYRLQCPRRQKVGPHHVLPADGHRDRGYQDQGAGGGLRLLSRLACATVPHQDQIQAKACHRPKTRRSRFDCRKQSWLLFKRRNRSLSKRRSVFQTVPAASPLLRPARARLLRRFAKIVGIQSECSGVTQAERVSNCVLRIIQS